jgi:DNA-binding transcriptional MerR regulator
MHCPRCGADALIEQQFCRSCGFNLEKVAELLDEQPAPPSSKDLAGARQHQRRLEHWAGIVGLALMSLVLLTLIYLIVSEMMIKSGKVGAGLLMLVVIIGGAVMAGLQGYSKALKQRLSIQLAPSITELATAQTKQLDPHLEQTPSVTEHTTDLLPVRTVQHRINTKES